jgi:hypothetical protein
MLYNKFIFNDFSFEYSYLYDTKIRENLNLYFSFKDKYEYALTEKKLNFIKEKLKSNVDKYDLIVYPETKGAYLKEIALYLSKEIICIPKNTIVDIKEQVSKQQMMKSEKSSLMLAIDNMDNSFQINKIKANQRKRFINILFKKTTLDKSKKILFFDDSIFGGMTFTALLNSINNLQELNSENLIMFSKQ